MTATAVDVAQALREHHAAAVASIRLACRHYESHAEAAAEATDPRDAGFWQAQRDMAGQEWTRALGAAAALETLARALGVDLPSRGETQ